MVRLLRPAVIAGAPAWRGSAVLGVVAVLIAGAPAWASDAGQIPTRVVTVCLVAGGNAGFINAGQAKANLILTQAGIQLLWRHDERSCIAARGIVVAISHTTPEDQRPGALAFARPFEGTHVVLFYDRVRDSAQPALVPTLLGYVLVHEIAHMLQGLLRHSATGIMKPRWNDRDFAEMRKGNLKFTQEDIRMIHAGLDRRATRPNDRAVPVGSSAASTYPNNGANMVYRGSRLPCRRTSARARCPCIINACRRIP